MEDIVRVHQEVVATQAKTKDEVILRQGACKLLSVARVVFTDPAIQGLRARAAEQEDTILALRFTLETCALEVIGHAAVLEAVRLYAHSYFGLTCQCRFCAKTFNEPEEWVNKKMRCRLFSQVNQLLNMCGITFTFMRYFKGNPCEDIPPIPEDFAAKRTIFIPDTITHLDKHIVFEQMGNVYDFKFGTPLHDVDSLYHPEGFKLLKFVKLLREKTLET